MSSADKPIRSVGPLTDDRRLDLLSRLTRQIAHDLNTQLTAILGFADLTLADPALPERLAVDVQAISTAAHRAGSLTAHLQTYCRPRASEPRLVDLDEVIAATRPSRERLAGRAIELVDVPAPALTLVCLDPVDLEWTLLDIVATARAALPDGGRLTFASTHEDGHVRLAVTGAPAPTTVLLPLANA
ncbi:hypothetical protein OJ998_26440 [Solirubrobacter taibaiensis]|nr:hypothetical protein [Solirubrobacter taibaiensis]